MFRDANWKPECATCGIDVKLDRNEKVAKHNRMMLSLGNPGTPMIYRPCPGSGRLPRRTPGVSERGNR